MLSFALLAVITVIAICSFLAIRKESAVFAEFHQNVAFGLLVLLYPLGALVMAIGQFFMSSMFAFVVSSACFLPGLLVFRRVSSVFDRAGTDRVKMAKEAASSAVLGTMVGLICVALHLAFFVATNSLGSVLPN